MKQLLQHVKSRELVLESVPVPALLDGGVVVQTHASLISAGTEKMLIDLAQKSMIGKAQARPDLVKQVLDKVKKEGLVNTAKNVLSKMEKPMPLGYSAAGIITEVANDVTELQVGDRVAVAGAGYANHADINFVPKNLVAKIPEGVSFHEAAYSTVASIALQGIRLAKPQLGENIAIIGLGLIGLITVQLLKANGCRVIGFDPDESKVELARQLGIDEAVSAMGDARIKAVEKFTNGRLADSTIITASTSSNDPVELAGEITRGKGQVVAVGAVGMDIPRNVYYHKELELKISMSYGPGRYDPSYEEGGIDYPYNYVRWTEQRNMQAVLDLMSQKSLDMQALTSHEFDINDALKAYDMIQDSSEPFVGIILNYDTEKPVEKSIRLDSSPNSELQKKDELSIGFIGAGNYASLHLLPHLRKHDHAELTGLMTATGLSAKQKADKFGFQFCTTNLDELIRHETVDTIFIATRHSTHAEYAVKGLSSGKHVFVEKPVVVNVEQLEDLIEAYREANSNKPTGLMVGLNRRFSPFVQNLKARTDDLGPLHMMYRVNSGHIPTDAWLYAPEEGGGMLVGEMCHFVDVMQFLCGEKPKTVFARNLSIEQANISDADNLSVTIEFDSGSIGTLLYNTIGDKSFSKERLEIFGGGAVGVIDDYKKMRFTLNGKSDKKSLWNQDKGQENQIAQTVNAFRETGQAPIPFDEIVSGMRVIFAIKDSLSSGQPVSL
jgi:predicted dehydrogenase/threonine dehydrogenase-like Zn-dependent dehydrogenase